MKRLLIILLVGLTTFAQSQPFAFWQCDWETSVDSLFVNQKSVSFDGINQYFQIPDNDNLSFTNDSIYLAAWVNIKDDNFTIFNKANEYKLYVGSGGFIHAIFTDSTNSASLEFNTSSITSFYNSYNHISVSFNGTDADIRLNGVKVNTSQNNVGTFTSMNNTSSDLIIGYDNSSYADGYLDQAVIGNKPFSIQENKELITLRDLTRYSAYNNVVSWWEFEDEYVSGTTIFDRVGSNDGTMVNSPTRTNCIEFPYSYQLNDTDFFQNATPFTDGSTSTLTPYGGFMWNLETSAYINFGANKPTGSYGSISTWLEVTGSGIEGFFSVGGADVTNPCLFALRTETASGKFAIRFLQKGEIAGVATILATGFDYLPNKKYHVVLTSSGTAYKIYVNGVETSFTVVTGADDGDWFDDTAINSPKFIIGAQWYDGSLYNPFDGNLGDIIIFDKELSFTEVNEVYNNHEPRDERKYSLSGNIDGYWTAYQSTNTTDGVVDLSGNGNHGTMTNMSNADIIYNYPRKVFEADSSGSFNLNGVDEYAITLDNDSLSFTNDSIFLSAWVNLSDATNFPIFYKENEYQLYVGAADNIQFTVYDSTNSASLNRATSSIASYENKWIHIAATFNGADQYIYLNGKRVDNIGVNVGTFTSMNNTSSDLHMGYDATSLSYADGYISNYTLGNIYINECHSQEVYNDGSPIDIREATFFDSSFVHYRFNQGDTITTDGVIDIINGINSSTINMSSANISTTIYPTN